MQQEAETIKRPCLQFYLRMTNWLVENEKSFLNWQVFWFRKSENKPKATYKKNLQQLNLKEAFDGNLVAMPICLFFPHVCPPVPKVFMATGQSPRTCTSTHARPAPGPPMLTQLSSIYDVLLSKSSFFKRWRLNMHLLVIVQVQCSYYSNLTQN